jgi:hypothetical protein
MTDDSASRIVTAGHRAAQKIAKNNLLVFAVQQFKF